MTSQYSTDYQTSANGFKKTIDENRTIVKKLYIEQYKLLDYFGLWNMSSASNGGLKTIFRLYGFFIVLWMALFNFSMLMQIATNLGNIDEIIQVMFMLATSIAVCGKFMSIKIKNESFENLFQLMATMEFLPKDDCEREILQKYVRLSRKVYTGYKYMSLSSLIFLFLTQYSYKEQNFPGHFYIPFEMNAIWKYNLMYGYQCMSLGFICLNNVGFDALATSLMLYLKAQLTILGHRLENIGRKQKISNISQDSLLTELKDCVRHYNRLLVFSHDIEYLISTPVSLQIGCSVFVLIANFYALSLLSNPNDPTTLLKFGLYQSCMLTQIFMLCYFSNEVTLGSSELSWHLYKSDWYVWNKLNRKMVLLMMIGFDNPIRIKSVNRCYSFNLAAFTSIVNSAYSYFALLKQMKD